MHFRSLHVVALALLLAGCSEKNPAMRINEYEQVYVPINSSSVAMLGGPVWKTEPGLTKGERDNLAYLYLDTLVEKEMLPALMVYTRRSKIPSGYYYRPMNPYQLYDTFMQLGYPLAIVIDPVVGAANRDYILKNDIRAAYGRMKQTPAMPLQISRAD